MRLSVVKKLNQCLKDYSFIEFFKRLRKKIDYLVDNI